MENISIADLQTLAGFIHEESNFSLRNKISAWVQSKSSNSDHSDLSQLASIASQSSIKEKIMDWISQFTSQQSAPLEVLPEEILFEQLIVEVEPNNIIEESTPSIEPPVKKIRKKKD